MSNIQKYKLLNSRLRGWLFVVAILVPVKAATANGWEHTAVPLSALVSALENKSAGIRQQAAFSLGHRHHSESGQYLIQHLDKGEVDERVRQTVYQSLGKIGSRDALGLLGVCLQEEQQALLRASCAAALGGIGGRRAEALVITALSDEVVFVQLAAIRSLGEFPSEQVNQALFALSKSEQPRIKLTAIESMGKNGNPLGTIQLLDYIDVDTQEDLLITVLQAIARIAGDAARPALEALYRDTKNERVRRYALLALSSVKAEDIIDYAMLAVQSDDFATRLSGLSILRETKSYGALPGLVDAGLTHANELYERPLEWFSAEPNQALLDLSLLIEYLRTVTAIDPAEAYALYAVASASVELARNSPVLVKISEGFYQARWQAMYAIGYTKNPAAENTLKQAAADHDSRIRSVAMRSIGIFGAHKFIDEVGRALVDKSAEVRWVAARVVGRVADKQNAQGFNSRLIRMLDDTHNIVRKEAVLSLGYLGVEQALEKLQGVLKNDTDVAVRQAAEFSVSLIKSQQ